MLWSDFQKPKKLDYDAETLTPNYGRFIAQPFERGFGTTIGNALRRVLLSSIGLASISESRGSTSGCAASSASSPRVSNELKMRR